MDHIKLNLDNLKNTLVGKHISTEQFICGLLAKFIVRQAPNQNKDHLSGVYWHKTKGTPIWEIWHKNDEVTTVKTAKIPNYLRSSEDLTEILKLIESHDQIFKAYKKYLIDFQSMSESLEDFNDLSHKAFAALVSVLVQNIYVGTIESSKMLHANIPDIKDLNKGYLGLSDDGLDYFQAAAFWGCQTCSNFNVAQFKQIH